MWSAWRVQDSRCFNSYYLSLYLDHILEVKNENGFKKPSRLPPGALLHLPAR